MIHLNIFPCRLVLSCWAHPLLFGGFHEQYLIVFDFLPSLCKIFPCFDDLHSPCNCSLSRIQIDSHLSSTCDLVISTDLCDHSKMDFDASLGFPGEGPWSITTANIDSFQTHPDCLKWNTDILAIQETRLARSNIENGRKSAFEHGKDIFWGNLLTEKKDVNGVYKVPHGGTAFLANPANTRNFQASDDVTGLWTKLQNTTRVAGIWHQVLPKLKVLIFCFYGQAHLPHEAHIEINQKLLDDLFTVTSQFGSIPILIAGDFQSDPDIYQAVVDAKALGSWNDPLVERDNCGELNRPITFSRGGNFKNPTENFSSIDGILMNDVALSALTEIKVCYSHNRQHAPIKASFVWPRIFQKGFALVKPAAFDLTGLSKTDGVLNDLNPIADQIWNNKYEPFFDNASDDAAWKMINSLAIETLQTAGAKFGRGPKNRGEKPVFKQVIKCPGQDKFGGANSKLSCFLAKTFQLVTELRFRLAREASKIADFYNTWNLQQKVQNHLCKIESCKWWDPLFHMHDSALKCVLSCLQTSINETRDREKRNRIADWKRRMVDGTKSKQVSKMVYAWIKSKTRCPTPNLIRDADDNIIVDPQQAISEINSQWDSVFAANVLHTDPMDVLKYAWPHIQDSRVVADIPAISGNALKKQALRRRIDAAPGLDGWRTVEIRTLPTVIFDVVARYFSKVESGIRQLPETLVLARQIILDKKGDSPLQKRLISLLPIFLLCYTSLRYHQLQRWQQSQMPPQLFGGIKARQMSQLQARIRLALDDSKTNGDHLIGVKIDKAKCFDRLVPTIASALMLAFGVPSTVVMVFSQLYANLKRILSYKGWISTIPTTCANGVIQGDSLSLIAINVHMAVWIKLVDKLPGMFAAVYVDDAYLWTHLDNCRMLRETIELSSNWDSFTGQLANHSKSSTWASNSAGRKKLARIFPNMMHDKIIDVLGAKMQTCEQKATAWDPQKTQKILRDLKSIKALPCPVVIKEHIIGSKISPQLAYTPHLSAVPKKELKLVQDQLVAIIWKNRPMWRCRWLIIAMLANPHRSEPFLTRAFSTIVEIVFFLKNCSPDDRQCWQNQVNCGSILPNSLLSNFRQACCMLGISHPSAFHLGVFGAKPVCFLDFGKNELRVLLKVVVRHQCYKFATEIKRKDIKPCNGFLNFPLTQKNTNKFKHEFVNGLPLKCFWESQVVGCTLTNDRKAKAGFSQSNLCRFCSQVPESLEHIINECPNPPHADERPPCPENCGPNFKLLGIVECSNSLAESRLQISSTADIPVSDWSDNLDCAVVQWWTDGSCENSDLFWETCGAFAIVDELGGCVHSGPVNHLALSSYSCELWAIIWAFCISTGPIECRSDSKTVVDQVLILINTGCVSPTWMHFEWWCFLKTIYLQRRERHPNPLWVVWIPAHVLEHLPCELISSNLAKQHNTTWNDIFCNRRADKFAKIACKRFSHIDSGSFNDHCSYIGRWQRWLALVGSTIAAQPFEQPSSDNDPTTQTCHESCATLHPKELTSAHPTHYFERILPKWMWTHPQTVCWISNFAKDTQLCSYASISQGDWSIAVEFFLQTEWFCEDNFKTSFIELAFHFWDCGFRFEVAKTPADIASLLRKTVNQSFKISLSNPLIPGQVSSKAKSNGKTFPAGLVLGGYPKILPSTLKRIAVEFFSGRSQHLKDWKFPF